jgi:hypothetical protein
MQGYTKIEQDLSNSAFQSLLKQPPGSWLDTEIMLISSLNALREYGLNTVWCIRLNTGDVCEKFILNLSDGNIFCRVRCVFSQAVVQIEHYFIVGYNTV